MTINILTVCPEMFAGFEKAHVIDRAVKLGMLKLRIVDIRDYAPGCFRRVDDSPYGGGAGMILRLAPVLDALEAVREPVPDGRSCTAALTPAGEPYRQETAAQLSSCDVLTLVCGHYEGMDQRICSHVDREICIGDYILSGGETAAMVVTDSVVRLLPGVLKKDSLKEESFSRGLLEYPQYTRPADYRGEKVPEVLLSGDHEAVRRWREAQSLAITRQRRPDLLAAADVQA